MRRPARLARLSVAGVLAALLIGAALALHGASRDAATAGATDRPVEVPAPQADAATLSPPAPAAAEPAPNIPPAADDQAELDLPPQEEIEAHKSFDPSPKLQRTPGGSLIVDAFIMDGPVRVEIRQRDSDELLLEQQSDTLFSFEVDRTALGAAPEDVVVRIYIDGTLAHELALER